MEQTKIPLPVYYGLDENNWLTYEPTDKKKAVLIGNYYPVVTFRNIVTNFEGKHDHWVTFFLIIDGEKSKRETKLSLSALEKIHFSDIDVRCYDVIPKACQHIAKIIRFQMRNFKEYPVQYYDALGWSIYNGDPVYVTGDRLINKDGTVRGQDFMLSNKLHEFHLDVLPEGTFTMKDIINDTLKIMKIDKATTPILLANTFAGLSRSLLVDAKLPIRHVAYLVGPSQIGKTVLACLTGSLYNRNTDEQFALSNLISTRVSIEEKVSLFRDMTYIIDDLSPENSNTCMKAKERTLIELIRVIGNNKEKERRCGKETYGYSPNAAVICTGEYLLKSFSTLARCIVLHMDRKPNWNIINYLNKKPLSLPTVALYYIQWAAANYKQIVRRVQEEHIEFRGMMATIHTSYLRVRENFFTDEIGMELFLEFCLSQQAITNEQSAAILEEFKVVCNNAFELQKLDMNSLKENYEIVDAIISCLMGKKIKLQTEHKYDERIHDGFIRENTLCLAPNKIKALLKKEFKISKLSIQAITKQLLTLGLLVTDRSASSTIKINRKRMIVISKKELESYIKEKEEL